jgi:flagellar protein FliS
MKNAAGDSYLFTEVMTAPPQKLHLLLLDAAIREGQRAKKHWQDKENEQAGKRIKRAMRIINGIIGGIDSQSKSELVAKLAGVYLFIYRNLTRAFIDADEKKLDEALRVLSVERETWRQVCEKLAALPPDQSPRSAGVSASLDSALDTTISDSPAGSFSLEA